MINLAGVKTCDETIKIELEKANIEIVNIGKMDNEVPASIIGKCNNFIFRRAWTYWVINGYMPLKYAEEMYNKYKNLSIRVAGHCGNPNPENWTEPKDYEKKCRIYINKWLNKEMTGEELESKCEKIRSEGEQFITHYHVDTQEGLNKFVEIIKNNNIIG